MPTTEKLWCCDACGAFWFVRDPDGKCPACKGTVKLVPAKRDESGQLTKASD